MFKPQRKLCVSAIYKADKDLPKNMLITGNKAKAYKSQWTGRCLRPYCELPMS